ncbi:hypothetical protein JF259_07410 [Snuella sp. CAU 1569]|uniref:Uncharacterized protein n=1 Tax=Snuella sedimenti TaxID=2798802 RepID=A0A8J7J1G1_9FLAO|nr:hypothetical protein [Snuella sedimenti]
MFLLLVAGSVFFLFSQADGYSDPYYLKFTSPKQRSLILGSSRAAQGIRPEIINNIVKDLSLYNYSFTILSSPFGKVYYESILKKLDTLRNGGVFVIEVNPWSISSHVQHLDTMHGVREESLHLGTTQYVNDCPNVLYLLKSYKSRYVNIIQNKFRKGEVMDMFLHDDGWLEVDIAMDSVSVNRRTLSKLDIYRGYLQDYRFSDWRYIWLQSTVSLLKKYGTVYLIRLPVHEEMLRTEAQLIPDFNSKMESLSLAAGVYYVDYNDLQESFSFTDGNHLSKTSASNLSKMIGELILSNRNIYNANGEIRIR